MVYSAILQMPQSAAQNTVERLQVQRHEALAASHARSLGLHISNLAGILEGIIEVQAANTQVQLFNAQVLSNNAQVQRDNAQVQRGIAQVQRDDSRVQRKMLALIKKIIRRQKRLEKEEEKLEVTQEKLEEKAELVEREQRDIEETKQELMELIGVLQDKKRQLDKEADEWTKGRLHSIEYKLGEISERVGEIYSVVQVIMQALVEKGLVSEADCMTLRSKPKQSRLSKVWKSLTASPRKRNDTDALHEEEASSSTSSIGDPQQWLDKVKEAQRDLGCLLDEAMTTVRGWDEASEDEQSQDRQSSTTNMNEEGRSNAAVIQAVKVVQAATVIQASFRKYCSKKNDTDTTSI